MENLKNKTFIITGGGRGIGAEASKLIASKGANVILTCRTESQGLLVEKEILKISNNLDQYYFIDFGCGAGRSIFFFENIFKKRIGIDINKRFERFFKKKWYKDLY